MSNLGNESGFEMYEAWAEQIICMLYVICASFEIVVFFCQIRYTEV